jgi:hypothetical protein
MVIAASAPDLRAIGPFPGVIQIVPTADAHELLSDPANPSGPVAVLTHHGGRTIGAAAKVQVIFLDGYTDDKAGFAAFAQAVVECGYYISPDGKDTASGAFLGAVTAAATGLPPAVQDTQLQAWLDLVAGHGPYASIDPNTLFVLVLGAGASVSLASGGSSCSDFCGYHSKTAGGNYYAVICDPGCSGCHGSFTPAQARQMVFSHEYGEWRSDPDGDAWYDDASGMENGDECAWQLVPWGPGVSPSTQEGALSPQGAAGAVWAVQPLAQNGRGCGDVPPYQAASPAGGTPQPPPHDWQPQHGLPLTPYCNALLTDQSILDPSGPAGALLAHVLAHPGDYAPGGDLGILLAWLQANPSQARAALDSPPLGAGWGAYLDRQGVA